MKIYKYLIIHSSADDDVSRKLIEEYSYDGWRLCSVIGNLFGRTYFFEKEHGE